MYEFVIAGMSFLGGLFVMMAKDFFSSASKETGKIIVELANAEELAMLKAKGTNAATKEDIGEITRGQEAVKATFQLEMEKQKSELSRISKEFELYAVKKHEYYPELNKNIELFVGQISSIKGRKRSNDFKMVNKEDIEIFMSSEPFTKADKEIILFNWDNNKDYSIKTLNSKLEFIEYNKAEKLYIEAHNFFLLHRLFFSEEVSIIARELLDTTYKLCDNYNPNRYFLAAPKLAEDIVEEIEKLDEKIDDLRNKLFARMKKELAVEAS